ncbi:transposase [Streptomyces tropicalis]|uniref:Transposase n=1 Tax=Streptomyces tropicalis TaxID=3034234 RepID=A0ABT6ACV9_9ACTN|nr:transposase [Streptomyces tropicalis]MDF3302491.1 transposase [Streptomyces tropicalis]
MPRPYPEEFRQDVVRVARNRGPGVTVEQVAADFGVHAMTLWKWMRRADIDDRTKSGTARPARPASSTTNCPRPAGPDVLHGCWRRMHALERQADWWLMIRPKAQVLRHVLPAASRAYGSGMLYDLGSCRCVRRTRR